MEASHDSIEIRNGKPLMKLSLREEEVILLIAAGLRDKDIGKRLEISPETVKTHIRNIMWKLESHTRPMAMAKYTLARSDAVSKIFADV
jgi:DNA-binding NarL/FixJ family response regulator